MGWVSEVVQASLSVFVGEEWQKEGIWRRKNSRKPLLMTSPLHSNGNETTMRDNALRKAQSDTDWNLRLAMIWVFGRSTLNEITETRVSMAKKNHSWMVERSGMRWSNEGLHYKSLDKLIQNVT